VPGPDGAEHVARHHRVDLLRPLALVGREQQPHPVAVGVERLLQVADRDLVGDLHQIDDRAAVGRVHVGPQVALLQVEVDEADGPAGRVAGGGEREVHRHGGGADAALGARDGDQRAAERARRALLARHAVAQRPRPLRGGADAGLELLERQRQGHDVADPRLHRGPHQLGRRIGREQHHPDLGEARRDLAREVHDGHGAERAVQRHHVDVDAAQDAGELLRLGDAVDDLEVVALGRERRGRPGQLVIADGDQQPLAHRGAPAGRR
jgi:hypothetical protein